MMCDLKLDLYKYLIELNDFILLISLLQEVVKLGICNAFVSEVNFLLISEGSFNIIGAILTHYLIKLSFINYNCNQLDQAESILQ